MQKKSFSQYLLEKGIISQEQLDTALAIQNKDRLLGSLAKELGILSDDELLKIKEFQVAQNLLFGEAAISIGLLTSSQLKYLLDVRLRRKVRIGEILVQEGFLNKETLYNELMRYEKNRLRLARGLVCDSSQLVTKILKDTLEKYNYEVNVAANPVEVLKIAVGKRPNLLIISQVFEEMSGLDVCRKLFAMHEMADLHIIFLAQNIDRALLENAFEAGVHHFLKKPVQEYELLNIIYNIEQRELEKKKEKILVVEDSELIRQVITRELRQAGYTVFQAKDGEEALVLAKREKPDLITLDIIMPGINGYETCKRLRLDPVTADTPVIMVTSCDTPEERTKGFEAGAAEYFVKPFAADQLANFIKVLFETQKTRRKETAVVIEDTKTTLAIIKHILKKQGLQVITAENGKEGLEKIKKFAPDIIICDIFMPLMDGFQVCHEVKTSPSTKQIPVILLTSSGKKEDTLKGLALGANDYIVKPFDEDELLGRVNNLLVNKKLYDELKAANVELEQKNLALEKLHREKENFYSILTHDLRAPLTSILGFSNFLLKDCPEKCDEGMTVALKTIRSAAERQLSIIEDALEIFQFEIGKSLQMEQADLGDVVQDILLAQFHEIKERGLELSVNGKPYSPKDHTALPCAFSPFKIGRVIENLVNNAAKYAVKKIAISFEARNRHVEFRVQDDGKGIPEKYLDKIFQDFFQIPGSVKGTGLGLSSAKRIVEAHKGKIWVDPAPGRCVFGFTLPLS